MKRLTILLVLLLTAGSAHSQFYQGPASGSVPGGLVMNTNNFPLGGPMYPGPLLRPAKNKERVHPLPDPPDLPPPSGPEGSNFMADPSLLGLRLGPPPITVGSFAGISQTNAIPPDPHIAVGPNHIMEVVNTTFRIFDKSGATLKTILADSWYGSLVPGVFVYDPKIVYDHFAGRWIMVWLDVNFSPQRGNYLISVSDDDNPLGVWYSWALPSTVNGSTSSGTWADYEGVGYDQRAVYLTSNMFDFSGNYQHVKFRILDKAQLYAGSAGTVGWTDFWDVKDAWGNPMIGTRPSICYTATNEFYLVGNSPFTTSTYLVVYRIMDPLTTPSIITVHIPVVSSASAPNGGQPNGATPLEGGGFNGGLRCEPAYRDGSLWVVHSVRSGSASQYASVRYVRIDVTADSVQEDVAFGAEGYWHIWPALAVDQDRNVAVTFTRTSASEFPAAAFTWRLATDPPGLRATEIFRPGANTYVVLADGRNRWGDYMGITVDPADRNNFWMATETVPAQNSWSTWIHGMRVVPYTGAHASLTAASLQFGSLEVGLQDTLALTLTNTGSDPLTITGFGPRDSAYSVLGLPALPVTVLTYDSLNLRVVFAPRVHGTLLDTLRLVSNDTARPPERVALRGRGVVIGTAVPGVLYATSSGSSSSLYALNTSTGAATLLGATGVGDLQGLAVHPVTHELYGVNASSSRSTLYRVSSAFGDALPVASVPVPNMRAIAFAGEDTVYGGTTTGQLFVVQPASGDTTFVGQAGGINYSGFSINPHSGVLWASVRPLLTNRDRIYTVNTTTGAVTLIGATGDGAITPSIAFAPTGILYGLKGTGSSPSNLIQIDTLTAVGTILGSTGVVGMLAITMRTDSAGVVAVGEEPTDGLPVAYDLLPNFPNPFNPETRITYALPVPGQVELRVFDVAGRLVTVLEEGPRPAGYHTVIWNGTNRSGAAVASGVYFCTLEARSSNGLRSFTSTRKMLLLR